MTQTLIRPAIRALTDYSESDLSNGGAWLYAHRNESSLAAPDHVLEAIRGLDGGMLRRYPVDVLRDLTEGLARRLGTTSPQIAVGNGADDILAAAGRAVLDPGDLVVTVSPTFGMYARIAAIAGAELRRLPYARRWQLDTQALLNLAQRAKLVILGHPNNPTGDALDEQTLIEIANALPETLIVVDEVYLSLSADSLVAAAASLPNVVVVGSLSKVAALAGMRVGYAVAQAGIAAAVRRVMPPFPIGVASLVAADAYVRGGAITAAFEAALSSQIERSLNAIVGEIGCFTQNVWRGCGNFVLMDFGRNAEALATSLRVRGIAVRTFAEAELAGCLRFCALDDTSTAALIAAVREAAATLGMRVARA